MRGWIIPTPLLTPVTVTSPSRTVAAFARVSVVHICSASAARPSSSAESWAARPLSGSRSRLTGSRVPIRPVEMARTWSSGAAASSLVAAINSSWSCSPSAPVAALAQPLVDRIARAYPPLFSRLRRLRRTGAAASWLVVNVPTTAAGLSVPTTNNPRSGRPESLMPARTAPAAKPAGMCGASSTWGRCDGSGPKSTLTAPRAAARVPRPPPART